MLSKFKPFCAPVEWKFKDPDTGFEFKAITEKDLMKHIREYRVQNSLEPLEFLESTVEHYLCQQRENIGACIRTHRLKRGIFQYIKGGIVCLQNMLYSSFAPQEKADERALTCVNCPHNIFPDKDRFLKWADKIAQASIEDRRSTHHDELGNCDICSCPLRSKVFFNEKLSLPISELAQMPDYCWQKKEVLSYG